MAMTAVVGGGGRGKQDIHCGNTAYECARQCKCQCPSRCCVHDGIFDRVTSCPALQQLLLSHVTGVSEGQHAFGPQMKSSGQHWPCKIDVKEDRVGGRSGVKIVDATC